jgi:NtrC-family two-component system response regulator AlgB
MRKPRIKIGSLVPLSQVETEHIKAVMGTCATLAEAAAVLGIEESTLWRKRRKWKLAEAGA